MQTLETDTNRNGFDDGMEPETPSVEPSIHPFDPAKIKVSTTPAPIATIVTRITEKEIDLAPAFQRRARLWPIENKSRLIESILLKIPLPIFYVAADHRDNWSVVDGIQRLTTIYDFCTDAFALSNLEYLTQFDGNLFKDLPRPMQRRILETALIVNIIQDGTPEEVMMNIFKRINTGGLTLTTQEIRSALYKEKARPFLSKLVEQEEFKRAHSHSIQDERMGGQELILRFFAFYLHPWTEYKQHTSLEHLLNQTMSELNTKNDAELEQLAQVFYSTMNTAHLLFGERAFRKTLRPGEARSRLNRALFEAVSVCLARLSPTQRQNLQSHQAEVLNGIAELLQDEDFHASISFSTASSNKVSRRFQSIDQLFTRIVS